MATLEATGGITTVRITYSESNVDSAANTSKVNITKIELKVNGSYSGLYGYYIQGSITVGGVTAVSMTGYNYGTDVYSGNTWYTVKNNPGSVVVAHNADGTKTVAVAFNFKVVRSGGGTTGAGNSGSRSANFTLTKIDRGLAYINGVAYQNYIDTGTGWTAMGPYGDSGTGWNLCS